MSAKKRDPKRIRVVPSLVVRAAFVGVVPACALLRCGGDVGVEQANEDAAINRIDGSIDGGKKDATADAQPDRFFLGVAYCCFDSGVADAALRSDADASDSHDGG